MADSGSYSPETILRRQKIADALLMQAVKPREIRSPIQGLGQLGEAALAGYEGYRANEDEKTARKEALASALEAFGGTAPTAATISAPAGQPPAVDASIPRGLRNNNPLNIEEGAFTQGQPGFSGSDGRFAKFDTPESGMRAANSLLDSYGRKGLNTPASIIGRWAPAGDGNNVSAYTGKVAQALGIGPNDPVSPEMRPQLIAAMGQHENGRPIGDVAAALQARPIPNAAPGVPAQPIPNDTGAPPVQMAQAASGAPPPPQNAPASPGGMAGGNREAIVKALMNPWTPPAFKAALASQLNPSYGFQTLPDGTILRTDPKTGTVAPIYKAESKPTFGVIGEDQFGNKIHGWIDPYKQTTQAAGVPGGVPPAAGGTAAPAASPTGAPSAPLSITGPDGKQIEIPAGQDPKKFREHVTTATADARAGKLTEVQANATQFANRMEDAEKNLTGLEGQAGGVSGAAQQVVGKVPVVGSAMQTKEYQKFEQAKGQFITALLRKESGAAISATEFSRYEKEFFPQPGDAPDVIAQKANARKVAIEAMKKGAGPIYESPKSSTEKPAGERKSIGGKSYVKQNGQWFEE